MDWERNPYYSPEKLALEIVYSTDNGADYEFDMFVVWKDADGLSVASTSHFYYATDSGCSCPSPFEDVNGLEDLTRGTKAEIIEAMEQWWGATPQDVADLTDTFYRD